TILLTDQLVPRSAADRDARTVAAALTIERMAPDVYTVAELTNPQHAELLRLIAKAAELSGEGRIASR
ncbi:MAG: hypothetical protein KC656_30685, partial [Myxococcales bacterium]|nr:hypothetical protein [Myxococcales bacterium]